MTAYQIRPYTPADLDAVVDLSLAAWAPVFDSFAQVLGPRIFARLYPDWRARQRATVVEACAEAGHHVWVAGVGGRVVGFIVVILDVTPGEGEVDLLAVHPAYQNAGIGTALNTFALEQMRAAGMTLAVVATGGDPGHAPARRSYEKAGYTGLPLVRYYRAL